MQLITFLFIESFVNRLDFDNLEFKKYCEELLK
jgi:hypothetical protein